MTLAKSEGENAMDIQTLSTMAKQAGESSARWDSGVIWFTAVMAVVVAIAILAVHSVGQRRAARANDAQAALTNAILKDKDLKIAVADRKAANANEKAQKLENDNLTLRRDLDGATGKVAGLQKNAADSKAAQQRVEIDLAKQKEKAAIAERSLLELQERLRPRQLSAEQRKQLIEILSKAHKAPIEVSGLAGDAESHAFAQQIKDVLKRSAWTTPSVGTFTVAGDLVGVEVRVHSPGSSPPHAMVVQSALESVGIPCVRSEGVDVEEGLVKIWVGHKP